MVGFSYALTKLAFTQGTSRRQLAWAFNMKITWQRLESELGDTFKRTARHELATLKIIAGVFLAEVLRHLSFHRVHNE